MGDPHRALIVISRCDVCEVETTFACVRCRRPLCETHKPARDMRCEACEADYAERAKGLPELATGSSSIEAARAKFRARPMLTWGLMGLFVLLVLVGIVGMGFSSPAGRVFWGAIAMAGVGVAGGLQVAFHALTLKEAGSRVRAKLLHHGARRAFLRERPVGPRRQLTSGDDR
jgi:hypothetical protein